MDHFRHLFYNIAGEQEFESDDADTIDRTSTSEDDDSEALIAAVTDAIRYFFYILFLMPSQNKKSRKIF